VRDSNWGGIKLWFITFCDRITAHSI